MCVRAIYYEKIHKSLYNIYIVYCIVYNISIYMYCIVCVIACIKDKNE